MIDEMNNRIKDLEQMIREKDIALMGLQAKNQGLQARLSVSEREHITTHATHAARCQLIQELAEAYDSDNQVTIEQVVDRLSGEPRKGGRQC
jgi:hypothetical protein